MSKAFNVVAIHRDGREVVLLCSGSVPRVWNNGVEAAAYAARYNTPGGCWKYQVRPVKPVDPSEWHIREQNRFTSGEYVKVPWHDEPWAKDFGHYVHVSKEDPAQIAFTENAEMGQQNRKTRMSPSKYLARYYEDIATTAEIRAACASYTKKYGDYKLLFAYSAEEIYEVYYTGPDSCMVGVEAVKAYAGPDLAVAYVQRHNNRITARTVVWPAKKLYCRSTYGDEELIVQLLRDEGYKASNRFMGARLTYIKCDDGGYYGYPCLLPSVECASGGLDYNRNDGFVHIL